MLDSLVRVSRRVGWVTDLLAASLRPPAGPPSPPAPTVRPPTPRECGGTAAFACDGPSRLPWLEETFEKDTVERRATGEPANNRRRATRRATGHLPSFAPQAVALALPDRLRRPSSGRQMRLAKRNPAIRRPRDREALPDLRHRDSRLNPPATGFRGPTRLPLSSFTYS